MIKVIKPQTDPDSSSEEKAQEILKKLKTKGEEEQAALLAKKLNLPYIDTNLFPVSENALLLVKEEEAKKFKAVPIQKIGHKVTLASPDPAKKETQNFIQKLTKVTGWKTKVFVISQHNFQNILERYKKVTLPSLTDQLDINLDQSDISEFEEELQNLLELKQRIKELPTTEVLNIIMAGAYKLGASDIHIEPQEKSLRMRYRIDGVLHDVVELPVNITRPILSRIKMMSGMKLNLRDIAQDGTFEINLKEKKIDVRVSIIPGNFGETLVMRLLDPDSIQVDLENLGLEGLAYEKLKKNISSSEGMILTTGPTGSGKTTTLYAIINKLNEPDKKIITIEDPIEYELKGISQTQIEKSRGYTFAAGLRSIVRQDPDIILVGEIRDDETADIAINSALTGHLVLSTIHTNSAIATIARLIEMGVKPGLITPSINAIIGQRLVRKLCDHCKESYVPAKESIDSIKKVISIISPKAKVEIPKKIEKLYRPKGCPKCNNIGYKGRTGIFEIFSFNKEIEKLVLDMAGKSELTVAALESGMVTMLQDGILKAIQGITTVEEVQRVTGQEDFLEEIYEQLMNQVFARKILIKKDILEKVQKNSQDPKKIQTLIENSSTKEINKIVMSSAVTLKASDIHLEPKEEVVDIRLRVDGILKTIATIPISEYPSLLGEIKILGGIKTSTRQGVTDSRFSIKIEKENKKPENIDVRLSIILGGFGETVVMRLLNQGATALKIEDLGIRKENLNKIIEEIKKPNGIILNTGPTGSGKTTTLYSIINHLNTSDKKIITIEDPIEYQLPGILQTSISKKDNYTFSNALKSLLRQNPDIMMIGEIRDEETAQVAVQAALTGHLLFSTIHTNNAAGSIQRMLNMNIPSADIAASVNAFMAQRLVRKLCDCKKKRKISSEEKNVIQKVLNTLSPEMKKNILSSEFIFEPQGCPKCNGIGYKDRTVLSEVLVVDKEIENLINQKATTSQIQEKAIENNMITILQDGVMKVLEGETTLEEIKRVTEI